MSKSNRCICGGCGNEHEIDDEGVVETLIGADEIKIVLDYVERHNKMDKEPEVAEAAAQLQNLLN